MSIGTAAAVGIGIAGAAGAGASIFGSVEQGNAANNAAAAQVSGANQVSGLANQATNPLLTAAAQPTTTANPIIAQGTTDANSVLGQTYQNDLGLLSPYTSAGSSAEAQIVAGLQPGGTFNSTPTADQVMAQDPGYQFRLQQGQLALERSAAAKGGATSGGALKALTQYAQDYSTGEYQQGFQNYNTTQSNLYNRLQATAQSGLSASQTGVGAGTALGTATSGNITSGTQTQAGNVDTSSQMTQSDLLNLLGIQGNAITGAANATASGYIGAGNAASSGATGVANSITGTSNAVTNAVLLQKLLGMTN